MNQLSFSLLHEKLKPNSSPQGQCPDTRLWLILETSYSSSCKTHPHMNKQAQDALCPKRAQEGANCRWFHIAEGSPEMIVCSVFWVLHERHRKSCQLRRQNLLTSPRNAYMFCNENWLTTLPSSHWILPDKRVTILSSPADLGFSSAQWHSFTRKNEKCSSSIPQSSLWLCG